MKKKLGLFLVGAMSVTMLAACSSKKADDTANDATATPAIEETADNTSETTEETTEEVTEEATEETSEEATEETTEEAANTYTATEAGFGGDITATVTLNEDGSIATVVVNVDTETPALGGAAGPQIAEAIVAAQSTEVDTVAGATVTSTAVINAVNAALAEAQAN